MADLVLSDLKKEYDNKLAINDFSLKIKDKEFVVILGPTGCGKSSLINIIAGLEKITSGDMLSNGQSLKNIANKNRDVSLVSQKFAFFSHMSIFKNLSFGLKLREIDKAEITKRVSHITEILGFEAKLGRKPYQLDDYQKQKVALGRALVRQTGILLCDELIPANFDDEIRDTFIAEIKAIHSEIQTTTIYATTNAKEALVLADRVVVMNNGMIEQIADPLTLQNQPANEFVASLIGK